MTTTWLVPRRDLKAGAGSVTIYGGVMRMDATLVLLAFGVVGVSVFAVGQRMNKGALKQVGWSQDGTPISFPYEGGHPRLERGQMYMWNEGEKVVFASIAPLRRCAILRSEIIAVDLSGHVQTVATNGTSIGGALVGGVLAGGAGAIIGSRGSNTHEVDHSRTLVRARFGDREHTLVFGGGAPTYDGIIRVLG
jgi:hypothetical protein